MQYVIFAITVYVMRTIFSCYLNVTCEIFVDYLLNYRGHSWSFATWCIALKNV